MEFTFIILCFGLLHLWGAYSDKKWLFYVFKPVTTITIGIMCWQLAPENSTYVNLILLGLFLSMLGDVFLMLPSDKFVPGLVSFLFAHVSYICAFTLGYDITFTWFVILPLAVVAAIIMSVLWPHLAEMKIPVIVYMSVIVIMAWMSAERYLHFGDQGTMLGLIGALVFLFSDATLAFDRFKKQFVSAYGFIIVSYYIAQYFIASSVL